MASKADPHNRRPVSPIPVYRQIEEDIRSKVRDHRLPVGAMLAGRHSLAKEYGVSLSTVQQAIANLIADGTLETYDRRGTFVAATPGPAEPEATAQAEYEEEDSALLRERGEPAHTSSQLRSVEPICVNLGILSTAWIDSHATRDVGSLWAQLAIRSMERAFSTPGRTTRYFDRFPDHMGPYQRSSDDSRAIPIGTAVANLLAGGADALAILALTEPRDLSDEILAAVDTERVPTVFLSWSEIRPPLAQVTYDSSFAGYQAAQHLLRNGYRRLLFIAPFTENWLLERLASAQH